MKTLDDQIVKKYLTDSCSESEVEQILNWLDESPDHEKELFNLKLIAAEHNYTQLAHESEISRSYRELLRINRYKKELEEKTTRRIMQKLIRYAASILLIIGLSTGAYWYFTSHPQEELIAVVAGESETVRNIMLEDSTSVWLFENSRIEYPPKFSKNSRNVKVEGKVYFKVAKDKKRPFLVDVGGYQVEALGTAFEVTGYKEKKHFEVILVEGLVSVSDNTNERLTLVHPGEQVKVNTKDNKFTINKVNAEMYTSWRNGVLEFDGQTFLEIAKVLERYYNVKIILDKPESMTQQLVGSLSLKKDIASMMKAIEVLIPIQYDIEVNTYVYIKGESRKI